MNSQTSQPARWTTGLVGCLLLSLVVGSALPTPAAGADRGDAETCEAACCQPTPECCCTGDAPAAPPCSDGDGQTCPCHRITNAPPTLFVAVFDSIGLPGLAPVDAALNDVDPLAAPGAERSIDHPPQA